MFIHDRYCRLDAKWLHSIEDFLGDDAINSQPAKREAKIISRSFCAALANVALTRSATSVVNVQSSSAASAPKKTGE
jgi:hypothetical protein